MDARPNVNQLVRGDPLPCPPPEGQGETHAAPTPSPSGGGLGRGPAPQAPTQQTPTNIARRRIHYFSGFDPRGAAHYHRLCREEAAKPQPHGGTLHVGPREKLSHTLSRWSVQWSPDHATNLAAGMSLRPVCTEHIFMGWDDLVRAHWTRDLVSLAIEFAQTYAHLFRHIGAARVWRMYRPAFNAGVLPLLVFAVPLLLGLALAAGLGIPGAVAGVLLVITSWILAIRAGLPWLVRIYTFFMRMGRGPIAGLDTRTREWVECIIARQQAAPVDEVLLVGHSVGTLVMVDAVDALLQDPRWQALQQGRQTTMLTLGQSYPMVALAPGAQGFRETLQRLSQHPALRWWDVTARIDALCFHGLHPLAGTGLPHRQAPCPVPHAARFMHMYEPARWARIRANKLQAHFLYLMTPQKPGNFSPLDVLYGPRGLAQQMKDKGEAPHA